MFAGSLASNEMEFKRRQVVTGSVLTYFANQSEGSVVGNEVYYG